MREFVARHDIVEHLVSPERELAAGLSRTHDSVRRVPHAAPATHIEVERTRATQRRQRHGGCFVEDRSLVARIDRSIMHTRTGNLSREKPNSIKLETVEPELVGE